MVIFQDKKYELFFSNKLPPRLALHYADEKFFEHFERIAGIRYRILSVIRDGWQRKHGLVEDIEKLHSHFEAKRYDKEWIDSIISEYDLASSEFRVHIDGITKFDWSALSNEELGEQFSKTRALSASLDAMTNMMHLFSTLIGYQFLERLKTYSTDDDVVKQSLLHYTQLDKGAASLKSAVNISPGDVNLSDEDSVFGSILRTGAFINEDVSKLLHIDETRSTELMGEISKRLSLDISDLDYLQISEIAEALKTKVSLSELVANRKPLTVLYYADENLQVIEGDAAEQFLKEGNFHEELEQATSEYRGQPGSFGVASGRAVVVQNSNEAIKIIEEGDILIAPYTAVEYVPAMKKAGAIVTEVGGITSHAAIVARELKIPCIVGVKGATKVFQTGMTVEVDADKGIIKKV